MKRLKVRRKAQRQLSKMRFSLTTSVALTLSLVLAGQFSNGSTLTQNTNNYVKNGMFDQGMAYWNARDAAVVPDPKQKRNPVIRVHLVDGTFALSQKLSLPVGVKSLSGSLRVRAAEASMKAPVQMRLRLYDRKGDSVVIGGKSIQESEVWTQIKIATFQVNPRDVKRLLIESNRGQGFVLIDDIVLH
jgi:hypothetical protein